MRSKCSVCLYAAALLALPTHQLFAQGAAITGEVRSAETSAPIVAALVQLLSGNGGRISSTLTNQTGRFQMIGIPAGTYAVLVTSAGYGVGRRDGIALTPGQTVVLNFELVAQVIDLDPIVVSASRRAERALDAPARTEVVDEQEIRVRPAVTPAEHLRSVPGIDIATSGVQSTNVVARGFNNVFSGALYMLTDHRIASVPSLRVNLIHFSPTTNEDLERIEVVLGPGSALYGPGTANGVLHMLTRSPLRSQGTTANSSNTHSTGRSRIAVRRLRCLAGSTIVRGVNRSSGSCK
jgi:iron complex outermembrane receptor protein